MREPLSLPVHSLYGSWVVGVAFSYVICKPVFNEDLDDSRYIVIFFSGRPNRFSFWLGCGFLQNAGWHRTWPGSWLALYRLTPACCGARAPSLRPSTCRVIPTHQVSRHPWVPYEVSELLPLQQLAQTLRARALQALAVCLAAAGCSHMLMFARTLRRSHPSSRLTHHPHSHTHHARPHMHARARTHSTRTPARRHHAGIRTHTFAEPCPCPCPTPVSPQ